MIWVEMNRGEDAAGLSMVSVGVALATTSSFDVG
jgi:hypothetical protein